MLLSQTILLSNHQSIFWQHDCLCGRIDWLAVPPKPSDFPRLSSSHPRSTTADDPYPGGSLCPSGGAFQGSPFRAARNRDLPPPPGAAQWLSGLMEVSFYDGTSSDFRVDLDTDHTPHAPCAAFATPDGFRRPLEIFLCSLSTNDHVNNWPKRFPISQVAQRQRGRFLSFLAAGLVSVLGFSRPMLDGLLGSPTFLSSGRLPTRPILCDPLCLYHAVIFSSITV